MNCMSFAEFVVRSGLETSTARRALLDRGAERPTAFGWDRVQLFKIADDLLWSPKPDPADPEFARNPRNWRTAPERR